MKKFVAGERTVVARERFGRNSDIEVVDHMAEMPTKRAQLALELVARWGMVAALPGGEDSAGRAKLEVMPTETVAERAITMADYLISRMEKLGWYEKMPSADEIYGSEAFAASDPA